MFFCDIARCTISADYHDTSTVVEIGGTLVNANEAEADILLSVEETTKKPVIVRSDAGLPTHATVRIARDIDPAHIVQYRTQYEPERAYLIGYQCGFILRLYQVPAAERFDISTTSSGRAEAQQLITEHYRNRRQALPTTVSASFGEQILSGIILQLRSTPHLQLLTSPRKRGPDWRKTNSAKLLAAWNAWTPSCTCSARFSVSIE